MDLSHLNQQQREAVLTTEGPMLLLAGAGTGKTRVITYRIAHLAANGVPPESILAVTFTNKAAREMRERVSALVSPDCAVALTVSTFHSFCCRLLRHNIHHLGYSRQFSIADESYQSGLVRTIMSELGCIGEGRDPRAWLGVISRTKSGMGGADDIRQDDGLPHAQELAEVFNTYQTRMRQMDLVDFDDLLVLVLKLWQEKPHILESHRDRYRYLMIDEYQDTNSVQFRLVSTLGGPQPNICVVGDDDQSIYGWRGADVGNILDFGSHFPKARTIRLEQNYRSTNTILKAANHVIQCNSSRHAKKLWSQNPEGERVLVIRAGNEADEADAIVQMIRDRQVREKGRYSRFAVLFRSNHQSRALENALRQQRVPFRMVGGRSFYQRKEILDVISLLGAIVNPRDDMSLLRIINVPPRGVGDTTVDRLKGKARESGLSLQDVMGQKKLLAELPPQGAAALTELHRCLTAFRKRFAQGDLAATTRELLEESGYLTGLGRMYKPRSDALRRRDNVYEFLNSIAEYQERHGPQSGLREFLEAFALLDANDREKDHAATDDALTLMTVHAAKGLEFPVVFVAGMERGLFPHLRSIEDHSEDEERRLFYVALTRAQTEVVLTYAEKRRIRGQVVRRRPSRFLDELPDELVDFKGSEEALQPAPPDVAKSYLEQMRAMFAPDGKQS